MVRAAIREAQEPGCIDGKTETRRLAWTGKKAADGEGFRPSPWQKVKAGDRLWVRENAFYDWKTNCWRYRADDISMLGTIGRHELERPTPNRWPLGVCNSIHMPRWASRLTLIVTAVKTERLQDITEADARAEGCGLYVPGHGWITRDELRADPGYSNFLAARMGFSLIWEMLYGRDSWESNPWVVAISFRPVLANIDSLKEQAA